MAELAASAFAALTMAAPVAAETAIGAGSIGGAAASVAAPAAAAASSGALTALQSTVTVASMVSAALGGVSGYTSHRDQALFQGLEAGNDKLAAAAEANRIQRELVKRIGDSRVAYAGAGLDTSSGVDIENSLRRQADFETSIATTGGDMRAAGRRAQQQATISQGYGSLISAVGKIGDRGLDLSLDVARRK